MQGLPTRASQALVPCGAQAGKLISPVNRERTLEMIWFFVLFPLVISALIGANVLRIVRAVRTKQREPHWEAHLYWFAIFTGMALLIFLFASWVVGLILLCGAVSHLAVVAVELNNSENGASS